MILIKYLKFCVAYFLGVIINKKRTLILLSFTFLVFINLNNVVDAVHVSCGSIITSNITLDGNLNCPFNGIEIGSDNVTLDCQGFFITGTRAPGASGIKVPSRQNVMIKNCNVGNFINGINFTFTNQSQLINVFAFNNADGYSMGASSNNTIINSTAFNNSPIFGFDFGLSDNNTIINGTAINNGNGFVLASSNNNKISSSVAFNNSAYGFYLSASNNTLIKNIADLNSFDGIYLQFSTNNTLLNNTANFNIGRGIVLIDLSSNNTVINNTANFNGYVGISLAFGSSNNVITNNTATSNRGFGIHVIDMSDNNIIEDNNASFNGIIQFGTPLGAGIYIGNCNIFGCFSGNQGNLLNRNSATNNTKLGIELNVSNTNVFSNIVCVNGQRDFQIDTMAGNTGDNNTCNNPDGWKDASVLSPTGCLNTCLISPPGCVSATDDLYVNSNMLLCPGTYSISDFGAPGVMIINSSNIVLDCSNSKIVGSGIGVGINNPGFQFNNVTIKNCNVENYFQGIILSCSINNTLRNNSLKNNNWNLRVDGGCVGSTPSTHYILDYYHDIDTSNTVNNKPVYYWTNISNAPNSCTNASIPTNAGFVGLVSCNNITVSGLNITNNSAGIQFVNTDRSRIENNTVSNSGSGISSIFSFNNTIKNNNVNSSGVGISLFKTANSTVENNTAKFSFGQTISSGIQAIFSFSNSVVNNLMESNFFSGIYFDNSFGNVLNNNKLEKNKNGISLFHNSNLNRIENNTITNNTKVGIDVLSSGNISANVNLICFNSILDFNLTISSGNSGNGNTCDRADSWNDNNTSGCTNVCTLLKANTSTGTGTTFFSSNYGSISNIQAVNVSNLPSAGMPNITFVHGMFSFNITGLSVGQTVTVKLTFPSNIPNTSEYWKFGPTLSNTTPHWYQIPFGSNDGDNVITINLTDGGLGDHDLTSDGTIMDPGGIGIDTSSPAVLIGKQAWPQFRKLNLNKKPAQTLFAKVKNVGNNKTFVYVLFDMVDVSGTKFNATTNVTQLLSGQSIELNTTFVPPAVATKYFVTAKLFYKAFPLPISDPKWIADGSKTFSFSVVL